MAIVELSRGLTTIVDDEDYERLSIYNWVVEPGVHTFYAVHTSKTSDSFKMHRFIIDAPRHMFVDHKNRNGLDNRKANLRLATSQQNVLNTIYPQGRDGSGYRGVSRTPSGRYQAQIRTDIGKRKYLGMFDTPEEAAIMYDQAAILHHGEFAVLNFGDT